LGGILVLRRSRSIDCRMRVRRGKPRAQSVGTGDSLHRVSPLFTPHVTISRTRGEYLAQGAASLRVHAPPALTSGSAHAIPRYFLPLETGSERPHPGIPALWRWFPLDRALHLPGTWQNLPSQSRGSRGLELTWNFPNPTHRFISGNGGRTVSIIRDSHASACESQDHGRRTTVPLHVFPVGKTTETYEFPPHLGVTCFSDSYDGKVPAIRNPYAPAYVSQDREHGTYRTAARFQNRKRQKIL
jgi:hypothetical protein